MFKNVFNTLCQNVFYFSMVCILFSFEYFVSVTIGCYDNVTFEPEPVVTEAGWLMRGEGGDGREWTASLSSLIITLQLHCYYV